MILEIGEGGSKKINRGRKEGGERRKNCLAPTEHEIKLN